MKSPASLVTLVALGLVMAAPVGAQPEDAPSASNNAAYFETRLSSVEDQMRALNGQVEQLGYAVRRLDQSLQRLQSDYDARLTKLETAVANPPAPPPSTATAPAATDATANGVLGAIKTQDGHVVGGTVSPQATPLPTPPADYGLTPAEQYDQAFSLLRQTNYDEAEKAFKAFIDKNPKDKLIDNAKYWYAETLYVRARFAEAAAAFADAFQQNPQGTKAADSLLKLAMSLAAIDKTADACVALGELKAKYPSAPAATRSRASEELVKLKCGGR